MSSIATCDMFYVHKPYDNMLLVNASLNILLCSAQINFLSFCAAGIRQNCRLSLIIMLLPCGCSPLTNLFCILASCFYVDRDQKGQHMTCLGALANRNNLATLDNTCDIKRHSLEFINLESSRGEEEEVYVRCISLAQMCLIS